MSMQVAMMVFCKRNGRSPTLSHLKRATAVTRLPLTISVMIYNAPYGFARLGRPSANRRPRALGPETTQAGTETSRTNNN